MDGFWGVARCVAGRESFAGRHLEERGFAIFSPRIVQRIADRKRTVSLFPGYIFVVLVDHWWAARRAPGVIDLIMEGERPGAVPQSEVDKILAGYDPKSGLVRLPKRPRKAEHAPALAVGTDVRIVSGSFCGLSGLYEGMSARERIFVLLEIFGAKRKVELGPEDTVIALAALA
jgi:transcription antitermination factor NusG